MGRSTYCTRTGRAHIWSAAQALAAGVPQGALQPLFTVPAALTPFDLEQDSHGRFYLSDPGANKVYQLDRAGKILRTFGRLHCPETRQL